MCHESTYAVVITPSAGRALKRLRKSLADQQFQRIDEKIISLASTPRPPGCEPLSGDTNAFRLRVGDYHIVYEIDDGGERVIIGRVKHRKDVYRH